MYQTGLVSNDPRILLRVFENQDKEEEGASISLLLIVTLRNASTVTDLIHCILLFVLFPL